jgi:hypothetical protein
MHIKVSPKVNGKRRLGEAFNEAPSPREPGQMVISGLHNLMSSCDPGQQATSPMTVDLDGGSPRLPNVCAINFHISILSGLPSEQVPGILHPAFRKKEKKLLCKIFLM